MKVIDLVVLDFNLKLKDKTVFKVLNQIGHDKYIYNRKDRKFYVFEYETENENISLVIDSKTIAWEIEIIEENKPIEKLSGSCDITTSQICRFNNIEVKINEIIDYLKAKEGE